MDDKTKWEVDRLKETAADHEKHLKELEVFKTSTIERLKTVFQRLKDIEKSNKWVSQSFFYLLFSGVITAVVSFISWLIQG